MGYLNNAFYTGEGAKYAPLPNNAKPMETSNLACGFTKTFQKNFVFS